MVISGLVSRIPDVRQRHRRVEPVEDAEGQGHVLDDGPKFGAVEVLLLQPVSVWLGLQSVPNVERQIRHQQKCDQISTCKSLLLGAI